MKTVTFLAFLIALPAATARANISFNFDNQSDAGLTRYNPLAAVGLGGTYSFPQLSGTNYGYRMQAPAVPQVGGLAGIGAAMGSFYGAQAFSDVNASVDFTHWNDSNNQGILLVSRAQLFPDGSYNGYVLQYESKGSFPSGDLNLDRVDDGVSTLIGTFTLLTLDPTHTYSLLLQNVGSSIMGQVVDVANPGTVLGTASATDSTYASGFVGIGTGAETNNATTIISAADTTFDNLTIQSVPEPASLAMFGIGLIGALGYGWRIRKKST